MTATHTIPKTTGRHRCVVPVTSATVMTAGTIGGIYLADSATESDGLAALDPEFTADLVSDRTPVLTALARALTFVGDVPVLIVIMLIAVFVLWRWTRGLRAPALLLFAMAGSAALSYGVKALVERRRPGSMFVLGPVDTSFAFPSGHTLNSTVLFVTLAALVWVRLRSSAARAALVASAVAMSVGIGLSRVYLGYHWATDVLAGWTVAVTWLALVLLVAYFSRPCPEQQPEA